MSGGGALSFHGSRCGFRPSRIRIRAGAGAGTGTGTPVPVPVPAATLQGTRIVPHTGLGLQSHPARP